MRRALIVAVAVVALAGCRGASDQSAKPTPLSTPAASASPAPSTAPGASPTNTRPAASGGPDYGDAATWLCRPGKAGTPCDGPIDETILNADGSTRVVNAAPNANAPIDCFYVYPTVSTDPGLNADLHPDPAETNVVLAQAAPFGQVCRLFVPLYRQLTLAALNSGRFGDASGGAIAYGDVAAAWQYYLQHDNGGRGFVLIGHSQGATLLKRLITDQIDANDAVRAHLVSAILAGTAVAVPPNQDAGGDFKNVPSCRAAKQRGCVVAYSTFNAASPPPALSLFGRVLGSVNEAMCVDPGALARGASGTLSMELQATGFRAFGAGNPQGAVARLSADTAYSVAAGMIDSTCVNSGGFSYLAVSVNAAGKAQGLFLPSYLTGEIWGLHILDVSIGLANLVDLVRSESGQ